MLCFYRQCDFYSRFHVKIRLVATIPSSPYISARCDFMIDSMAIVSVGPFSGLASTFLFLNLLHIDLPVWCKRTFPTLPELWTSSFHLSSPHRLSSGWLGPNSCKKPLLSALLLSHWLPILPIVAFCLCISVCLDSSRASHFFGKSVLMMDWAAVKRQCLWKQRWSVEEENHSWCVWKPRRWSCGICQPPSQVHNRGNIFTRVCGSHLWWLSTIFAG